MDRIEIKRCFNEYRQLLEHAKSIKKENSFVKKYADHLNSLDQIETAFTNEDFALLTNLIEGESRYYGWSYLPDDHGEKVENDFRNLKKLIIAGK